MPKTNFQKITPEIERLAELTKKASEIDPQLYIDYGVNLGNIGNTYKYTFTI